MTAETALAVQLLCGIAAQLVVAYGSYRFFTGKAEARLAEHERRLNHIDRGQGEQWAKINKTAEDLAYVRGELRQGKAAGQGGD